MDLVTRVDKVQKVNLKKIDPGDTRGWTREKAEVKAAALLDELRELQEWMYAAGTHSVLVVLQGMDTSGKDGLIAHVMGTVNPQGCDVVAFKVPTPQEAGHDFLWRVHQHAPPRGMMMIFNRSHYEDVLVPLVHKLIDKKSVKRRYEDIRNFEELLTDSNTIIIKVFLQISKEEQERRLRDRESEPEKSWKLSASDWKERTFWEEYVTAYETAISVTGTQKAPWLIVPSNHKWFRSLAVAQNIVETLRPYRKRWEAQLKEVGRQRLQEIQQLRIEEKAKK